MPPIAIRRTFPAAISVSTLTGMMCFRSAGNTPKFKEAMKLVIFGLTISSSWGNGHATIWRGLCRALIRRGHRVIFFERDVPYYAAHRDQTYLPGGHLCLYPDWNDVLQICR